jgi:exopolyphosphatase/guanosine-5'-triphosphate,3'-diphosphate pyrophosphatase
VDFARRFNYDAEHADQVSRLAASLLEELGPDLGLTSEHEELLHAAAIMHDVGYYISYERHHRQSHHLISHSQLPGYTAREIRIIAAVARYHRGSLPKPSHEALSLLDKRDRPTAIALAALMRAADGMDRARSGQVVSTSVDRSQDSVTLVLSGEPSAAPDLSVDAYGAQEKSDLLAQLLGREVRIRVETPTSPGVSPQTDNVRA